MHNKHIAAIPRQEIYETCLFRTQRHTLGADAD